MGQELVTFSFTYQDGTSKLTWTLRALLRELLRDLSEFLGHVLILLLFAHLEVVLLLEADEHVAEVVSHKVLQQGVDGVGGIDVVLLHHFIREVGTCFEGETLRLAKGVVTVEEHVLDLEG